MTSLILQLKKLTPLYFTVFALGCLALMPKVQAVSPPPDGGYAGGNTAEGQLALAGLTSGIYNTGVGIYSLLSLTTGNDCTGVGAGTLLSNTADGNTAIGAGALFSNTTGDVNTATGDLALFSNTEGSNNTAAGTLALADNSTGDQNTAIGSGALGLNSTGNQNTAVGSGALDANTTGGSNIALGVLAGSNLTAGINNIDIGNSGVADESSTIRIGGAPFQTAAFIAGISGTAVVGDAVVVDGNGQLGTVASSARFKKDIKPMNEASEAILGLKPVSFRYKSDTKERPQFGLIAEEVAKVNPNLIVRDQNGGIYSVRYDAVNAMLLNEFLKDHRTVQEQGVTIARQQKQIEALSAGLQKVTAQLEVSKPAPQTVLNSQ
jgi:hypothetical protein